MREKYGRKQVAGAWLLARAGGDGSATFHSRGGSLLLDESGYIEMWQQDKSPEAPGRVENLRELGMCGGGFLEQLAGFSRSQ